MASMSGVIKKIGRGIGAGLERATTSGAVKEAVEGGVEKISRKKEVAKKIFVDNLLLNNEYKKIGPVKVATKGGLMDELVFHSRGVQDVTAGAIHAAKNGVGKHHIGQLLKRSDNSLLGYETTKLGTAVIMGGAMLSGVPGAAKEFNETRQGQFAGVYQMGAIPGLVPQGHAYQNNAGATGDLVFALNNNR